MHDSETQPDPSTIQLALTRWPGTHNCSVTLINYSENHTYRIDSPEGPRFTLRLHRPGYQTTAAIKSELAWLTALAADDRLNLARPIIGNDGAYLQELALGAGDNRHAVLFAFAPGRELRADEDLIGLFATLGTYAAIMHDHAENWRQPPDFERQHWSAAHILDADGLWGNWRIAPGVDDTVAKTLHRLDEALRINLARYGTAPHRYGLIHADMRLGNVLADGANITLIDFDDCGFCWFAYEFAAAISFYEAHPMVNQWKAAWLDNYERVRPLERADRNAIDTMILLRRMALLAWIGSHSETGLAQTHMPRFAENTARLAEGYLDQRLVSMA
ncbi:phosphotransferase [Devosia rhodophyticola]|uniref:Phosphotransferase n=1 Tax=Devosia rhodophyticola TaxID=3026423 RepID=A0ABY7YXT8_9HYPH|nr:phosphotransferase [Devosia rhodophyticola]WDR06061.1 phosphotransferase [Devosia rhodophyticola]